MKKSLLLLAVVILGMIHFSCKKEDQNLTKTELITGNTWKIVSKVVSPPASMGGITIEDVIVLDSEEQRNYSYKYNSDGSMVLYNHLNEEIFRTTWTLSEDETEVTYNPGIVYTYSVAGDVVLNSMVIESITQDKMVTKMDYNFAGTKYLATFTYVPK